MWESVKYHKVKEKSGSNMNAKTMNPIGTVGIRRPGEEGGGTQQFQLAE